VTDALSPLRVLLVEDSATDAKLVIEELRRIGRPVEFERVEDATSMRAALAGKTWDVVLADWSMPKFSCIEALAVLKVLKLDLPFIVVSGTIGEETVALVMQAGAHDYVLKARLARLPIAVAREVANRQEREATRLREAEHHKLEHRYRRIIEAIHEGVFVCDIERRIVFANARLEALLGYNRGELLGKEQTVLTLDADRPLARGGVERRRHGVAESGECRLCRKDGTELWVLQSSSPLLDDEGRHAGMFAMVTDLTARRRAEKDLRRTEEQLRQSQKMDAVGRLAGGIAHDFNNVLSVILSYAEMMLTELKSDEPLRIDVKEIHQAARRAADLTRQLLMFSRQQVVAPTVLDLNDVLTSMAKMFQRIVGADVQLVSRQARPLGRVLADPSSVEQVIMNLVVNARDAMPTGGKLTMETTNVLVDEAFSAAHEGLKPGPHVMLAVTDTGPGIDAATIVKIFDPFFTTKGTGKGTGLGLSTVFGIVHQSGGTVWVESEPGTGTTFKVVLPCVGMDVTMVARTTPRPMTLRGFETILLVEDDDQVRIVAAGILAKSGYRVLEARNGGEALLSSEKHPGVIHLLLTDVVMPEMSGPELASRLAIARPAMKVLCMSGYTDDRIVRHGVLDAKIAYLQKPITPATLTKRVREMLDGLSYEENGTAIRDAD